MRIEKTEARIQKPGEDRGMTIELSRGLSIINSVFWLLYSD
jgi:hypothetical protein